MANDKPPQSDSVLERRAFDLFAARRSQFGSRGNAEQVALECYRDAEAFVGVMDKIKAGELTTVAPQGVQPDFCCAPNLKPTHPVNMVSAKFWNPQEINRIAKILKEDHAKEIKALPEYEWNEPEVNQARAIFPAFATSN